MTANDSRDKKRIYSLDVLRILAIFGIVFYHYQQVFNYTPSGFLNLHTITYNSSLLVEFFFILSGFLAFSDIKKLEGDISVWEYFKKKYARLIPSILLPCLAYTLICYLMRSGLGNGGWYFDTVVDIPGTITAMLGIQFWGVLNGNVINYPLWYVDVLIFCYILLAVLVKLSKRTKISCFYAFAVIIFTGIVLWNSGLMKPFFNMYLARGFYAFFAGIYLARFYNRDKSQKLDKVSLIFVNLIIIVAGFAFVVGKYDWFGDNGRYIYTFIIYPAIVILFLNSRVRKIFDFKWIGTAGKISYDIYAWHIVIFLLYTYLNKAGIITLKPESYAAMFIWFGISVVWGILSYFFFDKAVRFVLGKIKDWYL